MISRDDGLTGEEGVVMDALCRATNAMAAVDRQHPDEMRDFCDGIHRCQGVLAQRVCRRAFPVGWPNKYNPSNPDQAGDWYANQPDDAPVPVNGAVGACVLNGCQNAEWSAVAREAIAERERLRDQKRTDDEREIAYVQTIGKLDAALRGMVDLYRHPDSGEVIVEAGSSAADDALIVAVEVLGR